MNLVSINIVAAIIFGLALVHTFSAKSIEHLGQRFPRHKGVFHLLGEVEVVFGFWAFILIAVMAIFYGSDKAISYIESRHYTEPLFVFVVMVVAASYPVLSLIRKVILWISNVVPINSIIGQSWLGLACVPLLGSLITEPAAMTLAALLLAPLVFRDGLPEWLKYLALGVLFVNVSIGGTLTSYSAPPVLMVASTWSWDTAYMASNFGWKATIAVVINATVIVFLMRKHLRTLPVMASKKQPSVPLAISVIHLLFLTGVVIFAHHPVIFIGIFMLFLGFTQAYENYQTPLILKEGLLVGFFLAGLVVLGGLQEWWLQPIVSKLEPVALFLGATALTAITDNAALTYLGSLITPISDEAKYMLVAGAVSGGGLTVIANAPNPAGAALLKNGFSDASIGAIGLLLGAVAPTLVAMCMFFFF
jgi:hypothetical protein